MQINNEDKGKLKIIAISADSFYSTWQKAAPADNAPWKKYWTDVHNEKTRRYGPYFSPSYFFIKDKKAVFTHLGYMKGSGKKGPLQQTVEYLLSK